MHTDSLVSQIIQLPACELQALTLVQQHQAGASIDWSQATAALTELRAYTDACGELTRAIVRLAPAPVHDDTLLLTSAL
jgi:hypothetical protein